MSVGRRRISAKSLAFGTALVTVLALAIPFMGTALAVSPTEPKTITLSPTTDSASLGVCNPRTITVTNTNGGPVANQTVTVDITQTSNAGTGLAIGFCSPVATTNPPSPTPQTPSGSNLLTNGITRCSLNSDTGPGTTGVTGQNGNSAYGQSTTNQPSAGTPSATGTNSAGSCNVGATAAQPANANNSCSTPIPTTGNGSANPSGQQTTVNCSGDFFTDANGQVYFGVSSTQAGTMKMTARMTASQTRFGATASNLTIYSNESTKTWVAGGNAGAKNIACVWRDTEVGNSAGSTSNTAPNNENAEVLDCKVTDAGGNAVSGVTVNYVVTAGPDTTPNPNQAGGPSACVGGNTGAGGTATGGATNPSGTTSCIFNHSSGNPTTPPAAGNGGPGTDTVVVFVELGCPPPTGGGTACGPGPQSFEPQVTLSKTFFSGARNLACTPATAQNPAGTQHRVTCTVTDRLTQPVPGVTVNATEQGPGHFTNQSASNCTPVSGGSCLVTNTAGQVEFTDETNPDEIGTQTFNFSITNSGGGTANGQPQLTNECTFVAGNPNGTTSGGNCTAQTTKDWVNPSPSPTVHTRSITAQDETINVPPKRNCRHSHHRHRCRRRNHRRFHRADAHIFGTITATPALDACTDNTSVVVTFGGESQTVPVVAGAWTATFHPNQKGDYTVSAAAFNTAPNDTCGAATTTGHHGLRD